MPRTPTKRNLDREIIKELVYWDDCDKDTRNDIIKNIFERIIELEKLEAIIIGLEPYKKHYDGKLSKLEKKINDLEKKVAQNRGYTTEVIDSTEKIKKRG